jgi:rare lipoprotein A (peptidoglycan hydrolase)/uncharacterized protein YkwD
MKKLSFAFLLLIFWILTPYVFAEEFPDVSQQHPYHDAIHFLAEKNVLQGYPDGFFRPERQVSRVEFLKIVLGYFQDNQKEYAYSHNFPDIRTDQWYIPYLTSALDQNLVSGYPDGFFRPLQSVNRVEALKILFRRVQEQEYLYANIALNYYDTAKTNAWYIPYVIFAQNTHLIELKNPNFFEPARSMSRSEVAHMVYQYHQSLQIKKKIAPKNEAQQVVQKEKISLYSNDFNGRRTANGEIFSQNIHTSSHRTLPFGSMVYLQGNNTGIFTRINDRGPFETNATFDVSQSIFETLAPQGTKTSSVSTSIYDTFQLPSKKNIPSDIWEHITINNMPDAFHLSDIFTIRGTIENNIQSITAVLFHEDGTEESFEGSVFENASKKYFSLALNFHTTGKKKIALFTNNEQRAVVVPIYVYNQKFSHSIFANNTLAPNIQDPYINIENNDTEVVYSWNSKDIGQYFPLFFFEFQQKEKNIETPEIIKKFTIINDNHFTINKHQRKNFKNMTPGIFMSQISSGISSSIFSMDLFSKNTIRSIDSREIIPAHPSVHKKDIIIFSHNPTWTQENQNLFFAGISKEDIHSKLFITYPNGHVKTLEINTKKVGQETQFSFQFTPQENGSYQLEINNIHGEALWNWPLYKLNALPILPHELDLTSIQKEETYNMQNLNQEAIKSLNILRTKHQLPYIAIDNSLSQLAQKRANDLAKGQYFGHVDLLGKTVNDYRSEFQIISSVGENLALSANLNSAMMGLFWSGSHRMLMFDNAMKRVGFGFAKHPEGNMILVQIFAPEEMTTQWIEEQESSLIQSINSKFSFSLEQIHPEHTAWLKQWIPEVSNNTTAFREELKTMTPNFGCQKRYENFYIESFSNSKIKELLLQLNTWNYTGYKKIGIGINVDSEGLIKLLGVTCV